MRLYLLKRNGADWDETRGFVIRATSEVHARNIADDATMHEGHGDFAERRKSTCVAIPPVGEAKILLVDFLHG